MRLKTPKTLKQVRWRLTPLVFRLRFFSSDRSQRKLRLPFASGIALAGYSEAEALHELAFRSGCTHFYLDASIPRNAATAWSPARIRGLRRRISKTGVLPVIHGDYNNPISSKVEVTRRNAVVRTLAEIDLARQLGALLVVHPSGDELGPMETRDRAREVDSLLRSVAEIEAEATRHSVPIWLENLPGSESVFSCPEVFELVLSRSPRIAMVYDVGHAHVLAEAPERAIAPLAHRMAAICLSDNRGDRDSHMAVGQGNIDWRSVLAGLRASHWQGLVVFETPRALPAESVDYLTDLF